MQDFDKVLGIKIDEENDEKLDIPQEVLKLIEERKQARIEKLKAETARIKGGDSDDELQDDGFIDAMQGEVEKVWEE